MSLADFDLDALRRRLAAGAFSAGTQEPLRPVGLSEARIGPGLLRGLGRVVSGLSGGPGDMVVLAAATPIRVSGTTVREVVEEQAGSCSSLRWVVLGPADGVVHADERTVADARLAAEGARCVITVGSGTITDIGKAAAPADVPLIAVQTATSVNGYADPFSVLMKAGVKRTTPTRWPDVLIADTEVLLDAPARLSLAGLGDMAAMFTATADWYLATRMRADGPAYRSEVAGLVRPHGEAMLGLGLGLAADPGRLADLAKLLTLSGIAMGVAGSTAPASGMEHAVSHLLEMRAAAAGTDSAPPEGSSLHGSSLHGEQVGVASVVAAATWAHVRERVAAGWLDQPPRLPDPDLMAGRIEAAFAGLDPTGAMAAECLNDYAAKIRLLAAGDDPLATLRASWAECDVVLGGLLIGPAELASALASAGLPARFGELAEAVSPQVALWAVANCALQRRRFCVADLAMLMGAWEDDDVAAVLAAADSAATESSAGSTARSTAWSPGLGGRTS